MSRLGLTSGRPGLFAFDQTEERGQFRGVMKLFHPRYPHLPKHDDLPVSRRQGMSRGAMFKEARRPSTTDARMKLKTFRHGHAFGDAGNWLEECAHRWLAYDDRRRGPKVDRVALIENIVGVGLQDALNISDAP
ncbi:MAG: hypothetical protein ABWX70_14585, partial [Hyphomicrobium sp.]